MAGKKKKKRATRQRASRNGPPCWMMRKNGENGVDDEMCPALRAPTPVTS